MSATRPRLIAFYLPQFHPIPENDRWWGPGFTEWNNVVRAQPRFDGHAQPHLPADLGFYDLRLPEARRAQAELAAAHGIEGFCYWHYWFGGKRLLERPFDDVLRSGEPDLPFCLAWANENWTRRWDGHEREILQAQVYGGEADDRAHFAHLLPAFRDRRAIRIDGKPIFLVYRPSDLPDPERTTALWRALAAEAGLPGLYLLAMRTLFQSSAGSWTDRGFDGEVMFQPSFSGTLTRLPVPEAEANGDLVLDYASTWPVWSAQADEVMRGRDGYTCVVPSWDNSARRKRGAYMLHGSTPEEYGRWLRHEIARVGDRAPDRRVVFINAWNEWAEGNHLEPDQRWGRRYLEVTRDVAAPEAPAAAVAAAVPLPARVDAEVPRVPAIAAGTARPRWSVMIPTFEPDPAQLAEALRGVLAQAPGPEEMQIEVVDDASTRVDVAALVAKLGGGRVAVYRQPRNLGFIGNWNACLARARGRWVHVLHQDDCVLPGFYARLGAADATDAGAAFCRHGHLQGDRPVYVSELERPEAGLLPDFLDQIARVQRIQCASIVVRRSVYEELGGYDPRAGYAADWEMWVRIAARHPIWFEPQPLACYRLHDRSATSRLVATGQDTADMGRAIALVARHLPERVRAEAVPAARRHYAWSAIERSSALLCAGQVLAGLAQLREGLRLDASPALVSLAVKQLEGLSPAPAAPAAPPAWPERADGLGPEHVRRAEALLEDLRRAPAAAVEAELRQLRARVAGWLLAPGADVAVLFEGPLGAIHRALRAGALIDRPLDEGERGVAAALDRQIAAAAANLGARLAAMLFRRADTAPAAALDVAAVPGPLLADALDYLFWPDADRAHLERMLALVEEQVFRPAAHPAWMRAAEHAVLRADLSAALGAPDADVACARRARLLALVLRHHGAQLDCNLPEATRARPRVAVLGGPAPALDAARFEVVPLAPGAGAVAEQVEAIRRADLDVLLVCDAASGTPRGAALLAAYRLARVQLAGGDAPLLRGLATVDGQVTAGELASPDVLGAALERAWRAHRDGRDARAIPALLRLEGYRRPGVTVVTTATAGDGLAEHVERQLASANEVLVLHRGALDVALPASPRVRALRVDGDDHAALARATAAAAHQWILRLDVGERMGAPAWAWLRRLLPYLAAACAGDPPKAVCPLVHTGDGRRHEPRLWLATRPPARVHDGRVEVERIVIDGAGAASSLDAPPPRPILRAAAPGAHPATAVLGMHRSGTSLTARVVNLLGVHLGDRIIGVQTPAQPDNPRGHWEDIGVNEINQQLLHAVLGTRTRWEWTYPMVVTPEQVSADLARAMRGELARLRARPRWGFKEPRTSLTLPAWARMIGPMSAILCVRDPRAVAASLHARDRIPMVDGVRLWFAYTSVVTETLEELATPVLAVEYERLVGDCEREARRIASFLALDAAVDATTLAAVSRFVDGGLEHHSFAADLRGELETMFAGEAIEGELDDIAGLYQRLRDAAACPVAGAAEELRKVS